MPATLALNHEHILGHLLFLVAAKAFNGHVSTRGYFFRILNLVPSLHCLSPTLSVVTILPRHFFDSLVSAFYQRAQWS